MSILTVLLAVLMTAILTTGQTVTIAVPPVNQTLSRDERSGKLGNDDRENSVKITAIPPIAIADKQKTRLDHLYDWGPWAFNLGLVVVGTGQVWFLYRTLKTVQQQANTMKLQTDLMERQMAVSEAASQNAIDSLTFFVNAERARI